MKQISILFILTCCLVGCDTKPQPDQTNLKTFCNPVNLSYRFCLDSPSRREAADPTIAWFKDRYYLFASKSGGYWHSGDLVNWTFIKTSEIPVEEYAPTVVAIEDTLYFLASSTEKSTLYKSGDPLSGKWSIARESLEMPVWDPALFLDDDKHLYLYWGCSNMNPIYGVEVDYKKNFSFMGDPKELMRGEPDQHGWEVPGDYNTLKGQNPWIEGAWLNKFNGKYYLQYAGPGTEFKSYSDGVYVADKPLGPFHLQPHNPFASKPEGFAAGAGHGSTFADQYGNLWHIGTITISQKHMFERRLGLYPVFLDDQGWLYANTAFGDYPMTMPQRKIGSIEELSPHWQLLSYKKDVTVSSSVDSLPPINMTDENIRTYWAAKSGDRGEYAIVDLGGSCDVNAVQINFAEHNTAIFGRQDSLFHRYILEQSNDANDWKLLSDKSKNETDQSHDYIQLPNKVSCRYLKITNVAVPGGNFAISDFRVFGHGLSAAPEKMSRFEAKRDPGDRRSVNLGWEKVANATGYNISFGVDENKLYSNYMVYDDTTLTINSLDANQKYVFTIEAFNENGVTKSGIVVKTE